MKFDLSDPVEETASVLARVSRLRLLLLLRLHEEDKTSMEGGEGRRRIEGGESQ